MKLFVVAALFSLTGALAHAGELELKEKAALAAVADGVTTAAVLAAHTGVEANPLMPATIPMIAAVTAVKAVIMYNLDEKKPLSRKVLQFGFAEFAGIAVNNALIAAHVSPVAAPIIGIGVAIAVWLRERKTDEAIAQADAAMKAAVLDDNEPVFAIGGPA